MKKENGVQKIVIIPRPPVRPVNVNGTRKNFATQTNKAQENTKKGIGFFLYSERNSFDN